MEKKLMFLFSVGADAHNVFMERSGVLEWINGDLEDVSEEDRKDAVYTIKPVMMTQQEIDALPEADL